MTAGLIAWPNLRDVGGYPARDGGRLRGWRLRRESLEVAFDEVERRNASIEPCFEAGLRIARPMHAALRLSFVGPGEG